MAGDEPRRIKADTEEKLLRRLRVIAGAVILTMITMLVTVDTFARLFVDPSFHASELFLGTLIGALMLLLGVETVSRLPKIGGNGRDK